MINRFVIISLIILVSSACTKRKGNQDTDTTHRDSVSQTIIPAIEENDSTIRNVFGVSVISEPTNYAGVLTELDAAGVLHIDSMKNDSTGFKGAVIEFAGIKFGVNKGYIFITSRHSDKDYRQLRRAIEKHYGKGDYDDETHQYLWFPYTDSVMSIRVRPLHGDDGGIVMFWSLPRPHSINDSTTTANS